MYIFVIYKKNYHFENYVNEEQYNMSCCYEVSWVMVVLSQYICGYARHGHAIVRLRWS